MGVSSLYLSKHNAFLGVFDKRGLDSTLFLELLKKVTVSNASNLVKWWFTNISVQY